jgi:hypothetical protein
MEEKYSLALEDSSSSLGGSDTLLSSAPTPRCLALRREREELGEEHGAAGRGARRGPSLVAGSSMLERGGGGKAPWWQVAACLREAEEGGQEVLVAAGSSW